MPRSLRWLCPLMLVFTTLLGAQPLEVPLTWSLRPEKGRQFFPLGFARPERKPAAPEGWKLPQAVSPTPVFATLRLGDRDTLFMLDQIDPEQPFFDRLYFDANGNQDLTDDPPVQATATPGRNAFNARYKRWYYHVNFVSPRLDIMVDGARRPYAFRLSAYYNSGREPARADQPPALSAMASAVNLTFMTNFAYTGSFALGERTYHVVLGDNNANGRVGDPPAWPAARGTRNDLLYLSPSREGMTYYDGFEIGDHLVLQDRLFAVAIRPDQAKLILSPYVGDTGCVVLAMKTDRLLLATPDRKHRIMVVAPGNTVRVPASRYQLANYLARRQDDGGNTWTVRGQGEEKAPIVEVSAGQNVPLAFGEPYRPVAHQVSRANDTMGLELRVLGAAGERVVGLSCQGQAASSVKRSRTKKTMPVEATYQLVAEDGEVAAQGVFKYG